MAVERLDRGGDAHADSDLRREQVVGHRRAVEHVAVAVDERHGRDTVGCDPLQRPREARAPRRRPTGSPARSGRRGRPPGTSRRRGRSQGRRGPPRSGRRRSGRRSPRRAAASCRRPACPAGPGRAAIDPGAPSRRGRTCPRSRSRAGGRPRTRRERGRLLRLRRPAAERRRGRRAGNGAGTGFAAASRTITSCLISWLLSVRGERTQPRRGASRGGSSRGGSGRGTLRASTRARAPRHAATVPPSATSRSTSRSASLSSAKARASCGSPNRLGVVRDLVSERRRVRPASRIRKRLPRDAVEPRKLGRRDVVDPPQGDDEDVGDDVLDEVLRRSAPHVRPDCVAMLLVDLLETLHPPRLCRRGRRCYSAGKRTSLTSSPSDSREPDAVFELLREPRPVARLHQRSRSNSRAFGRQSACFANSGSIRFAASIS